MLLELSGFWAPPAIRPGCGPHAAHLCPPLPPRFSPAARRAEKVSQSPHKTHCKYILHETNAGRESSQVFPVHLLIQYSTYQNTEAVM